MARNAEVDIQEIQRLRTRVRNAEQAATAARVKHEQADEDLTRAKAAARELGIDPKDINAFDKWLDKEAAAIETVLESAEETLRQAEEALNGDAG